MITTTTYLLPSHWASALINCDPSGLSDEECHELDAFTDDLVEAHGFAHCVDVEHYGMTRYTDVTWGILVDASTFTFHVERTGD